MSRPRPFRTRVGALVLALLSSLAAPSAALAHGVAHDHMRTAHHAGGDATHDAEHDDEHAHDRLSVGTDDAGHNTTAAPSPSSQVAPAGHTHRHAHQTVDRASGSRDSWRLAVTTLDAVLPTRRVLPEVAVVQHAPAVPEGVCLARPAPELGAPPTLRAPPLS